MNYNTKGSIFMTILKKSKAIIAAMLVVVTMFACTMTAFAEIPQHRGDKSQNGYTISMYSSSSRILAFGKTTSNKKAETIDTAILTVVYDKNKKEQVAPVNKDVSADNSTNSGMVTVTSPGSNFVFNKVTFFHSALFKNEEIVFGQYSYTYNN